MRSFSVWRLSTLLGAGWVMLIGSDPVNVTQPPKTHADKKPEEKKAAEQ